MIKKHEHRKHNRKLLKLPRSQKTGKFNFEDSLYSSGLESETSDADYKPKNKNGEGNDLTRGFTRKSTNSIASSGGA
jgi:hypothetical protein